MGGKDRERKRRSVLRELFASEPLICLVLKGEPEVALIS